MPLIYIVEDDQDIREIILYALQAAGFLVSGFETGEEFFKAVLESVPHLVILDIMLPVDDGLSILKKLRRMTLTREIPIIMLSAKGSEVDKVKGLDLGADDYITKPFGVVELISRVKALLRRTVPAAAEKEIKFGNLTLNNDRREVIANDEKIELTYKEYELLSYLIHNSGRALNRERIMKAVWDFDFEGESRTLDMHIRSLRKKLGTEGEQIKTVRNIGYKFGD
ncbi:MAG: response regulator transcription factor [Lachnospiraceae bacterium]|nr:response regulator transcription factor [Lachnospiraceae bacterium]